MDQHELLKTDGPVFHLLVAGDSELWNQVTALQRATGNGLCARFVRGRKAMTTAGFFDEFAAAFQFPYYFGENWDALNDCITDLEWLPGDGYVVIITHASNLLEKERVDALKHLVTVFNHAAQHWNKPEKGKKAKAFQVVLHATHEEGASLKSKWHQAGVSLSN